MTMKCIRPCIILLDSISAAHTSASQLYSESQELESQEVALQYIFELAGRFESNPAQGKNFEGKHSTQAPNRLHMEFCITMPEKFPTLFPFFHLFEFLKVVHMYIHGDTFSWNVLKF